jgi:transcriptional regulator with XRE-family HTH domain
MDQRTTLSRVLEQEGRRQSWLARHAGVHASEISRIVNRGLVPSDAIKGKIAAALDRPVDQLFPAAGALAVAVQAPSLRPSDRHNLHGQDTGREALTPASLATLLACERKFQRQHVERLAREGAPTALDLSAAFTAALDAADPDAGAAALGEDRTGATVVREAARAHLARHGGERLVRGAELRVRLRNPATGAYSRTFDLAVRLDGVTPSGAEVVQDRLVGQLRRGELPRALELDRRVSLEAYALWRAYGVLPAVRVRMALKPAIRQTQRESFDEYLARIGAEYAARPDHYLAEETAHRTLADLLRLEQELWRWAEQVRAARADGLYPRNVSRCHDFGGCPYLPLCRRDRGAQRRYHERVAVPVAPPDGAYTARLADAGVFADGAGAPVLKLTWEPLGGGHAWTVLADGGAGRRTLRALGTGGDASAARGGYYELIVATRDGVRETAIAATGVEHAEPAEPAAY